MKKPFINIFLFIGIILLCSFLNDGFMGTDEYWTGMSRYLPAQSTTPSGFLRPDDVKSPLQMIPFWLAAKSSTVFGIVDPYIEYRWMLVLLGLVNAGLVFWGLWRLRKSETFLKSSDFGFVLLFFTYCFFIPFTLTRPMFETLAAPWLFLTGVFALEYELHKKSLVLGTLAASIAFLLRPQAGLCALIFPILTLYKKDGRDFLKTAAVGVGCFILFGFLDSIYVGNFHGSLLANIQYNFSHGSEYGKQSVLTYPALLLGLGLIPWFLYRGSKLFDRSYWRETKVLWIIIALFVLTHSLISQKFERFLVPILPLYALAMLPVFKALFEQGKDRPIRFLSLLIFNLVLWIAATWFAPQKNIIDLARFLNAEPQYQKLFVYKNTPDWIPEVFIYPGKIQYQGVESLPETCDKHEILVIGEAFLGQISPSSAWQALGTLNKNPADYIAYKLNPEKNQRRSPLKIYRCTL